MKTMNIALLILILFGFLESVFNQLTKGPLVIYHVSKLEGCLLSDKSFLSLAETSINQCAEECFLRPQCMAMEYERRFKICELLEFARTETVPRSRQKEDCIYLRKSEITVRNPLPSVCDECVSGETCDLELLQCVKKECKKLNLINGVVFGNMNSDGTRVKYTCHPGFARAQIEGIVTCIDGQWRPTPSCIADNDECASGPCKNGATCSVSVNNYACKCALGYEGTNCEIDINECSSSPCKNGATCVNGINNYACRCAPGYAGTNCELGIDECSSRPCKNGATCVDGINNYACRCAPGYAGTTCELDIYECASSPCFNGATCEDGINNYVCKCALGYDGTNCEIDINECASSPCTNGATCKEGINYHACICAPGYAGTNCQIEINECASSPCMNGATCFDSINKYACICVSGYAGTHCQIDLSNLTNVALGKPTKMSSDYSSSYGSKLAVDGNTNQHFFGGSCFHTVFEFRSWWQVDLEAVYDVYIIRLYNRMDCCRDRASNMTLLLGNTPGTIVAVQYKVGQIDDVQDFELAGNQARYVNLTLNTTNYFHLCEVQVFGILRERTNGRECSQDSDCLETASQCISSGIGTSRKCFCNKLYRYNSTSRDCEKVCTAIQDNFIKYDNKVIKGYNSIAYLSKMTFDECREKCIFNSECMSFEWVLSSYCDMGIVSLAMINDTDPTAFTTNNDADLYSRSCQ